MMNKMKRTTVKNRITSHVMIAIAVTVSFLTIVNMVYLSRQIIGQQRTKLELATQVGANKVEAWLGGMAIVTEDMASSLTAFGNLSESTVRAVVDRAALNHPEFFYVYFADYLGNMTMARGANFVEGMDPRDRVWYKRAAEVGHTVVIDPYASASRPDVMMCTVATPVFWGTTMVGVVAVDADIESIQEFVNTIDFEAGSYGILLDSKDNIIVHHNSDYNPTSEKITSATEVMPEIDNILSSTQGNYEVAKDYTGKNMVYSAAIIPEWGWKIAVAYPQTNFMKHVYYGIGISLLVAVFCLLLAIGDITYTIRKVLSPLSKINPAMDNVMNGDFTTKLNFATENDEIGDLQNKLAMTLEALSNAIKQQKAVLSEMEKGNLTVKNIDEFPGELNEIATAVNSIKETFNDIISDIQFSAINLQSFAMGINETSDLEEMRILFEELSAEANALMEKTAKFTTIPSSSEAKD